jgi:NTP pyrophosphatase (non-canonical NTP hydrolase)
MGKFKDVGSPAAALAEECAEVIQVITKLHRFSGDWDEILDGKGQTRWEELVGEMTDVLYQWNRLVIERHHEANDNDPAPLTTDVWGLLAKMNNKLNTL